VPELETGDDLRVRPLGVTLLAILQALTALASALSQDLVDSDVRQFGPPIVFAAIGFVLAFGLWRLQRWAWVASMVWQGVGLAIALYLYFDGDPDYWWLATGAVTVLYLNQGDVQRVFAPRRRRAVSPAP
jgi:hypothetical protein